MFTNSNTMYEVTIIYNKADHFGLEHDANVLKHNLSGYARLKTIDPLEHPSQTDINIHLEVPIYSHVPWATYNIFIMNPECYKDAWDPYMKHFDIIITKEELGVPNAFVLPWIMLSFPKTVVEKKKEFLYLVGHSVNKKKFAEMLLPFWKESYPTLHVYSTMPLDVVGNVKLYVEDLTKEKRLNLLQTYEGHICCSMAEGFGYSAAEAEYVEAFTILNTLSVYKQAYQTNVFWLDTPQQKSAQYPYAFFAESINNLDLDSAIEAFKNYVPSPTNYEKKQVDFRYKLMKILDTLSPRQKMKNLPPILDRNNCPEISVITLIYNRRRFIDLARHNLLLTDYPKEKIQWVIVDDSDDINEQASDKIIQTQTQFTGMDICYVPLLKKTPISQKRNIGVERSTNDIILFMDDDDHYPETSFRRRVAWLTKHPLKPKCVACTTIACYDLVTGVSAVNCPPLDLPLGQRISEATLTFYKSWFEERNFEKNIQVGEGEPLVKGREDQVLEILPQQIIVAFSHGKNTSSRRIPSTEDVTPSCFWGFHPEFLKFVHSLAGITVVNS